MRLILFILGVLTLIGWAGYRIFVDDSKSVLTSASESVSGAAVDSATRVANYASTTNVSVTVKLPPIVTSHYRFEHRPIPSVEFFQTLINSGSNSSREPLKFTFDKQTRTVVLIGHLDEVTRTLSAFKLADAPAQTCHAKAWVVFVRTDTTDSFDFALELKRAASPSLFSLSGKTFSGLLALDKVEASISLMRSRGLVEVVQAPHIQISDGSVSRIETGEEIAVPIVTVNQNVTQTTVEYRKVGLSLELLPQFLAHDKLRLNVKQTNGLVGQSRDIGGAEVPELSNQTLENTIETKVGKVVVLGGVESVQYQRVRGILSHKKEKQTGRLYVVLATYSDIPKARPVLESAPSSLLPPAL